jgi:hypothetical protein
MTTDVATAEREADEARQAASAAENDLASGRRPVGFDALHKLRDRMRHADLAASGARAKAEQQRQEARAAALGELGKRIDALAATAGADIAAALRDLAEAAGRARAGAAAWDAQVAALAATARDLGAAEPAPGGPRPADGGIAVSHDGRVWHRLTLLQPVSDQAGTALAHALAGDAVSAIAAVKAAVSTQAPARQDHYLRSTRGGAIHVFADPLPPGIAAQAASGELVPLSESEILAYLQGDLR